MNTAASLSRYIRFCCVGATGVIVDSTLLLALSSGGVDLSASKLLAGEAAIVSNYMLNDYWTFRDRKGSFSVVATSWRFAKFNMISFVGVIVSLALLHLQVRAFGFNVLVANAFAIVAVSIVNYFLTLHIAWRPAINSRARLC